MIVKRIVSVTQSHIDESFPENPYQCAVARAVRDTFPEFIRCSVTASFITVYTAPWAVEYVELPTPKEVKAFLPLFDSDRRLVSPFSFPLGVELP